MGPDVSKTVKALHRASCCVFSGVIHRYALTQTLNFTEQLEAGIRYLDMRIAKSPRTGHIHVLHAFYGHMLERCLKDINSFLNAHPKECVLLDFNHIYGLSHEEHQQCLKLLCSSFGEKICPCVPFDHITLTSLWAKKHQVIIFYHSKEVYGDFPSVARSYDFFTVAKYNRLSQITGNFAAELHREYQ